jgi:hypothetical protein
MGEEMHEVERPEWAAVQPTHKTLEQEGLYLVRAAAASGLAVRAVGGVAVFHRLSDDARADYERVRSCPHDIDLLVRPKTSNQVKELFMSLGYVADERLIAWQGEARHRYFHLDEEGHPKVEVDVFLGKPPLCHEIDFMDRLDLPGPAMSATDLLLQKLQIHNTTEKDLIDTAFLLGEFPVVHEGDGLDVIVAPRIADLLAANWGFHYDATNNLDRLTEVCADGPMPEQTGAHALAGAATLREAIDAAPKGRRWKMRAKVGTRAQWYEDVEEVLR